jgi:hypothetical protein
MSRPLAAASLGITLLAGVAGAAETKFSRAQLEEMIAPIALYPDEVLSTVCIAATYPLEVVEADRWRDKNPSLQGDALDKALQKEDWDASVKSLTSFPDVLDRMSNNLEWTKDLGDAFLDQRSELMDAAQSLRTKAYDAGTLKTTPQQTVVKEEKTIYLQPTNPQVVYVPSYAPSTVYGPSYVAPAAPSYPSFWATPGGAVTAGVVGFGAGIATGALIGSAFDWNDHDVYVHNYYGGGGGGGHYSSNANINVNRDVNRTNVRANRQEWKYNPEHRRGVGYRDPAVAKKYGGRDRLASASRPDRDSVRGFDRTGAQGGRLGDATGGRPGGGQFGSRPDRPGGGQAPNRQTPPGAGSRPAHANRPQAATRPAARTQGRPTGAFGDAGGRGAFDASRRGAASRGSVSHAGRGGGFGTGGGVGGGGHAHGGGYGRGGGGGRRGGGGGGFGGGGRRGGGRRH